MVGEKLWIKVLRALLKVIVLFVFVSPFYIALCYAVKSRKELAAGRLNFPQRPLLRLSRCSLSAAWPLILLPAGKAGFIKRCIL